MAPPSLSQAVQQAGSRLQAGMTILSASSSSQPVNLQKLAELSAAAAQDVWFISQDPSVKGQAAQWKGIIKAAVTYKTASTAAAYMTWFGQVLLTAGQASSSSNTKSTLPTKSTGSSSGSASSGKQQQESWLKQAFAGFTSALEVLKAVVPDYKSALLKVTKGTSTAQHTLVQAVLGSHPVGGQQQGLLKVLQQLLSLQPGMPVSGFLYLRIITATLHTYMLLSRAAAAIGSFETAAHLLEEGLLLGMQLPEKSRWMCLQPVLKELRVHLVHAEEMKPYNRAVPLLYWQLVVKHKDMWWLGLCAATSALQQVHRRNFTPGPDWASTHLAQALAPGVQLRFLMTKDTAVTLLAASLTLLLCAYDGTMPVDTDLKGATGTECPARGEDGGASLTLDMLYRGSDGGASLQPTLLQLQAAAELLCTLQDTAVDVLCMGSLLLGVLVAAAELGVQAAFLGSIHFQQVVGVLHRVAGSRMKLALRLTAVQSLEAAAAADGPVYLSHTHSLMVQAEARRKEQGLRQVAFTLSPQQLVVSLLQALTMVPDTCKGQGSSQEPVTGPHGLRYMPATCKPLASLGWAPGLPLTPPLWGLLERCVRAEGAGRYPAMWLGERWVQLAMELLGKTSAPPPQHLDGVGTRSSTSSSSSSSGSRPTSWYGAMGSLWISMAKSALVRGDYVQLQTYCNLAQQLVAALAHHPALATAERRAAAAVQPGQQQQLGAGTGGMADCLLLLGAVQRMVAVSTWAASWLDGVSKEPGLPLLRTTAAQALHMHFCTALKGVNEAMAQVCRQYKAAAMAAQAGGAWCTPGVGSAPVQPPLYPTACRYPGCINLSGPSEVTLVTNRGGVVCGGCGVVRWCCRECAASSWPAHCKECKRLKEVKR